MTDPEQTTGSRADMYSGVPRPDARVRVGTAVIVIDDAGRLLLEKRSDSGLWGLPGGRVESGESLVESAVREVREETGLQVHISGLVGVYSDCREGRVVTFRDNGDVVQLVDVVMEASDPTGTLTASAESETLKFFRPGDMPWMDICPPARKPLRDFIAGRRNVLD